MPTLIEGRVLGPVELTVGGRAPPPELLWRKNLALFLYLAFSPRRTRARDHLMGLLWGDKPEAAARHSLREALRILRRSLGDRLLHVERNSVALRGGSIRLDSQVFAEREAAADWAGAAELVQGEFLEGFGVPDASPFEDWLGVERAAWRARSLTVLVRRSDQLLASGDASQAARVALRARGLDPTSRATTRVAMQALALCGDRAGALAQYRDYADGLREIDVELDRDVEQLAARVRDIRDWRLPASVPRQGGAELKRPPLIGREQPLEQLLETWRACHQQRRASIAVVVADPGMGKTRLAEELVARARLDGAATVTVRAVEADLATAGSGLLAIGRGGILQAAGVPGAAPDALAAFAAAIPEWAERFGTGRAPPKSLGAALAEVLRAAADEQPIVVVLDDGHWLDRESLLATIAATRSAARSPILVCIAIGPQPPRTELDDLRARIGRDVPGVVVTLRPFDADQMHRLAEWALPDYTGADLDRLSRRLVHDSAGIPLLAVELLHALALGLDLGRVDGTWPAPFKTLDHTLPGDLPDALVAAIRVGFGRLSPDARSALRTVAVLGHRVPVPQIAAGTALDAVSLASALDELEWQRWLTAEPRGYSFVARIVREVVARDMLTAGQRQRIVDATTPIP